MSARINDDLIDAMSIVIRDSLSENSLSRSIFNLEFVDEVIRKRFKLESIKHQHIQRMTHA